jgi:hypothetical protein
MFQMKVFFGDVKSDAKLPALLGLNGGKFEFEVGLHR